MVVDFVGVNTQYGKTSEELSQKTDRPSPLQARLLQHCYITDSCSKISLFKLLGEIGEFG